MTADVWRILYTLGGAYSQEPRGNLVKMIALLPLQLLKLVDSAAVTLRGSVFLRGRGTLQGRTTFVNIGPNNITCLGT